MKKCFIYAAAVASLCISCADKSQSRLVIWDKSEYVAQYTELSRKRFSEFGERRGIEVEYVVVPPNNLKSRLFAAIEAKNPPDIVVTDDFLARQFAGMNQLADMSEVIDSLPFTQAGLTIAYSEGGNYAVPLAILAPGLYLRKDKWDAAGLPYPTTWEELRAHARIINDPEHDFYALGYPMGASGGGDAESFVRSVILSFGGVPIDAQGRVSVNTPETRSALEYIASLYTEKLCPPSSLTWDDMGNNTAYIAGSVGVIQNSPSVYVQLAKDNPELYRNTLILPYMEGPAGRFVPTGGNVFIVFKEGGQTEAAKEYIKDFFEFEFYRDLVIAMGGMWQPVIEGADADPFWEKTENAGWLLSSRGGVPNTYPAPANELTTKAFSEQLCVRAVQKIVLRGMDVQQALDELEADLKRVMGQQ